MYTALLVVAVVDVEHEEAEGHHHGGRGRAARYDERPQVGRAVRRHAVHRHTGCCRVRDRL